MSPFNGERGEDRAVTLLLGHEDMEALLSVEKSLEALRDALRQQADGRVQMPARQTMDAMDSPNWLRISSAFLNGADYMGFKSMNRAAGLGMRYLVALYRISTGELVAIMDANWLTTQRTAATNALGTHLLAPAASDRIGIIGSGVQAQAFIRAYASLRGLKGVTVYSPREESRQSFAEAIQRDLGIDANAVDSAEKVARECETAVLAMRAPFEPVYRAEWLRPGVHVTGLSSVRKEAREVEDEVWSSSDLVVVDDRGTVFQSGDGLSVAASGAFAPERCVELHEVVTGLAGRRDSQQVTLFKSAGNAMQDVAVAIGAFETAVATGRGREIEQFPIVKPYD